MIFSLNVLLAVLALLSTSLVAQEESSNKIGIVSGELWLDKEKIAIVEGRELQLEPKEALPLNWHDGVRFVPVKDDLVSKKEGRLLLTGDIHLKLVYEGKTISDLDVKSLDLIRSDPNLNTWQLSPSGLSVVRGRIEKLPVASSEFQIVLILINCCSVSFLMLIGWLWVMNKINRKPRRDRPSKNEENDSASSGS